MLPSVLMREEAAVAARLAGDALIRIQQHGTRRTFLSELDDNHQHRHHRHDEWVHAEVGSTLQAIRRATYGERHEDRAAKEERWALRRSSPRRGGGVCWSDLLLHEIHMHTEMHEQA